MDEETKYWVGFSLFPGIGPLRFKLLLDYFGCAEVAWHAPQEKLRLLKLPARLVDEFLAFRKKDELDAYIRKLAKLRVSVVTLQDTRYPPLLAQIPDAPFLLYVLGRKTDQPVNLKRTIAVVGTRKITPYGIEVTRKITTGLVSYGFTVVSGLAYGVDAAAHQTALDSGGKTIAVLGCGIDIIAPASNARLYHDIVGGGGAIVSEVPLSVRPNKGLFPARNRIISGLSLGVVVTEGADDSGALITARYAAEQGREVFAVPGPITSPYSRGPAKLLKNGAKLVESVGDILEELNLSGLTNSSNVTNKIYHGDSPEEQKVLVILSDRQMSIDDLVRTTGLTISMMSSTLTVLEMKGVVKDFGEKVYGLAP